MDKIQPVTIKKSNVNLPTIQHDINWSLKLSKKEPTITDQEVFYHVEKLLDKKITKDIQPIYNGPNGYDFNDNGYIVSCDDESKLKESYKLSLYSMSPLPLEVLEKSLEVMYSTQTQTGGGRLTPNTKAKQMAVLLNNENIPADIANHAIQYTAKKSKWWATFAELWEVIGWRIEKRKKLVKALENKLNSL